LWWLQVECFDEKGGVVDYRFLAKTKSQSISVSITYILFLTEMQKRQILEKEFANYKNDITTN
jgi:hypothetical protein